MPYFSWYADIFFDRILEIILYLFIQAVPSPTSSTRISLAPSGTTRTTRASTATVSVVLLSFTIRRTRTSRCTMLTMVRFHVFRVHSAA